MRKPQQAATLFAEPDDPRNPPPPRAASGKPPAKNAAPKSRGRAIATAQPQPPAVSRYELVGRLSLNKDVDAEKMRTLLEMLKDEERIEAERLFDEAMLAAQTEMPEIPRESYNKHTKAWWARIESVSAKCDPVIRKHGFSLSYGMGDPRMEGHYYVFADVTWRGRNDDNKRLSFTKRYGLDIGRDDIGAKGGGTKTGAQGSISVLTYGKRNLKLSIFDVLVLGMDKDGAPVSRDTISAEQVKDLRKRLKVANISEETFCEVFKIDSVDSLGTDQLEAALARIDQKMRIMSDGDK